MRQRYSETMFYRAVGDFFRDARTRQHVSIKDLSARTGLTAKQIQAYERGDAQISALDIIRLADALGISAAPLFENNMHRAPIPVLDYHYLIEPLTSLALSFADLKETIKK